MSRLDDEARAANVVRMEHISKRYEEIGNKDLDLADFRAYMPTHQYLFIPDRSLWPAISVNERVENPTGPDGKPIKPSVWLDRYAPVEQMTWCPGEPTLIEGRLMDQGGWVEHADYTCFNLYRPPDLSNGDPAQATPWLDHVHMVFPNQHEHIINWLAHRVQRPGEKINHALVLGGRQGIGKDTILEPVVRAVGPWNCNEVHPAAIVNRFNSFVKSVILRVSEARDLGDSDRFKFYDHTKTLIAAPPEVLRVDEKHTREYNVPNVAGVIITTNHKSDGLYLPPEDRRHYVAWSSLPEGSISTEYFDELYRWYERGGYDHVSAYLAQHDLSGFNPKKPPPKTEAFWHMVNANRAPEDSELADVLDRLGNPVAVTLEEIKAQARNMNYFGFVDYLDDRRYRRQLPHRMEAAGYEPVRNDMAKDGLWKVYGKRQVVYGLISANLRDRVAAASKL